MMEDEFTQMLLPEMNPNYCCSNWTLDQSTVINDSVLRLNFCLKQSFLGHTQISQHTSLFTLKATDKFNFEKTMNFYRCLQKNYICKIIVM